MVVIQKTRTPTPLHPQSNGTIGQFSETLEEHLSEILASRHLQVFLIAYRCSFNH